MIIEQTVNRLQDGSGMNLRKLVRFDDKTRNAREVGWIPRYYPMSGSHGSRSDEDVHIPRRASGTP